MERPAAPAAGWGAGRDRVAYDRAAATAPAATRVRRSGAQVLKGIRPPTKTYDVKPVYPPVAADARVQGVVIIEIRIDEEGHVSDARILRSIPLLDAAALEAVQQWEFTPTLMNGKRVPVIMTTTVNFTLQ